MPRRSKVEELKNLLNDNTLSTLSMVGFEEIATSGIALLAMTEYSFAPRNDVASVTYHT